MRNYFFHIKSALFGKLVGVDALGNRYYCNKHDSKKRWVMFKGIEDASKVPPQWHGWLHGMLDEPLDEKESYSWQKEYLPNMTGTVAHHVPKQTNLDAKHRPGYDRWRP